MKTTLAIFGILFLSLEVRADMISDQSFLFYIASTSKENRLPRTTLSFDTNANGRKLKGKYYRLSSRVTRSFTGRIIATQSSDDSFKGRIIVRFPRKQRTTLRLIRNIIPISSTSFQIVSKLRGSTKGAEKVFGAKARIIARSTGTVYTD